MVDDFCHSKPANIASIKSQAHKRPCAKRGHHPPSSLVGVVSSERDFYRYARPNCATPSLPCQIVRSSTASCATTPSSSKLSSCTWSLCWTPESLLTKLWIARRCPSGTASVGGMDGWPVVQILDGPTLGWYEGFSLLSAVDPTGVITGFCFGAASTADQHLAETFFALRARPNERLISVGSAAAGPYIADKGFEGAENHRRWLESYGAHIIHAPKRNSKKRSWSKRLRRWIASIRQIVENVYDKLFNTFGLWRERPHELEGLRSRLAARVALHNFCIWLNDHLGRPRLAFADLLGW